MKKYDLIDTVSRGSNVRKEINPQLIVETDGNYGPGQIFDANATIKLVQDGISSFIGDAPDTLDTLEEISTKIQELDNVGFSDVALSGDYNDLTNKPTIPDAQIQSDWNQVDSTAKDFIKNKPTIPAVPTNVSSFTNDAGYLTNHQDISGKQDVIDTTHKLSADLIEDGTTNKVINVKPDWNAASGSSAEILNKPTIPAAQVQSDWNASTGMGVILNKPTIPTVPTNISAFTNDANYITNTDSIVDVKSAAMVELHNEITGLTNQLSNLGNVNATSINLEQFPKVNTYPIIIYGSGAPTDVPRFIGQLYVDTTTPSLYCAKAVTNSTGDWFNV